jgi:two-component system sensor histidine kinase ChvG
MASDTGTASPERRPRREGWRWLPGSRLGRLIIVLNLFGLAILISGALVLNELRRGLVNARIDSLTTQGELIATIIDQAATVGEPEPMMDAAYASEILQLLSNPRSQRARLFDAEGRLIADSYWVSDRVEWRTLPPARTRGDGPGLDLSLSGENEDDPETAAAAKAQAALRAEVNTALRGVHWAGLRMGADEERVVSVSIPIQHVKAVLGVLTLEARDVDEIIAAERAALLPFILIAISVSLISSLLLNRLIAHPVRRLARAADRVRLARARAISVPDISRRDDELGDLSRSLEDMTHALSERIDAIERFAADVAHEIRNPLTSLRSAVETLGLVEEPAARDRLMAVLQNDVQRLDRLVTDISNASRLDAELSRETPTPVDLRRLISDVVSLYQATARAGEPRVVFTPSETAEPVMVSGQEGALGQVLRNLIDNARSFSAPDGEVRVGLSRQRGRAFITVDDDGPGIPPENLESIFERFYTSRPKGTAFGGNSGLGLSIVRQIVVAHDGSVRAENRRAEGGDGADGADDEAVAGARFTVILPEARR